MPSEPFHQQERDAQIAWRRTHLTDQETGEDNRGKYRHVLPAHKWQLNLWPAIRSELPSYLRANKIQPHTGKHNLCSSWALCANLYFPFRSRAGRSLLGSFLAESAGLPVTSVERVELEWEADAQPLKPSSLLGEARGSRGSGQTSPDVAFEVETRQGPGIILVESKYTEHSFYQCSGYRARKPTPDRPANPDPTRCMDFTAIIRNSRGCHLTEWKRTYWQHLRPDPIEAANLAACPAAFGAYQLFRQQALAEALRRHGSWQLVVSAVAFDERNDGIFNVLRLGPPGRAKADARELWGSLFGSVVPLVTFTHQRWVAWVRKHDTSHTWGEWLEYIGGRYRM